MATPWRTAPARSRPGSGWLTSCIALNLSGAAGPIGSQATRILYANGTGAIIQVKSRDPIAAVRDDTPEKVQGWIDKHGAKASRQGQGTRRQLLARRAEGRPRGGGRTGSAVSYRAFVRVEVAPATPSTRTSTRRDVENVSMR